MMMKIYWNRVTFYLWGYAFFVFGLVIFGILVARNSFGQSETVEPQSVLIQIAHSQGRIETKLDTLITQLQHQ